MILVSYEYKHVLEGAVMRLAIPNMYILKIVINWANENKDRFSEPECKIALMV